MSQRIRSLDIAKGICLICMILGHTFAWWNNAYPEFNKHVGPFFLVFFYIASAMCYRIRGGRKEYVEKRIKRLLVPYIIFCVVYALYLVLIRQKFVGMSLMDAAKTIVVSSITALPAEFENIDFFHVDTYGVGPIWFLNCMFWVNIVYMFLYDKKYRVIITFAGAVVASISQAYFVLPFNIQVVAIGCLFMAIGDRYQNYIKKYIDILLKQKLVMNIVILLPLLLMYVVVVNYLPYQWMNLGGNVWFPQSLLSSILGILSMLMVVVLIERTKLLDEILEFYGRNSMFILVLHSVDIMMLRNWAMRDWAFVEATLLGYPFVIYLWKRFKKGINEKGVKLEKSAQKSNCAF